MTFIAQGIVLDIDRFSANNTKTLIDMPDKDACTVSLCQETLCKNRD